LVEIRPTLTRRVGISPVYISRILQYSFTPGFALLEHSPDELRLCNLFTSPRHVEATDRTLEGRWTDEIVMTVGKNWMRKVQQRNEWAGLGRPSSSSGHKMVEEEEVNN
jgi:hypothetical protein